MKTHNPGNVQLGVLVGFIPCLDWNKMSGFSEAIHYNPNGVVSLCSLGKSDNKIYTNIFPIFLTE